MRLGSIISETLRNIASGTAHALAMFLAVLFAGTLLGGYEAMSVMGLETEAAVRIRAFADVKTVVGGNVDGLACDRLSDHGDPSFISGAMRSGPQVVPLATKGIELSSYEVTAGMIRLITAEDPQEVPDSSGVWVSSDVSHDFGLVKGSRMQTNHGTVTVAGVFDWPNDGRDMRFAYAMIAPAASSGGVFQECWAKQWPQSDQMDELLLSTATKNPKSEMRPGVTALNKGFDAHYDAQKGYLTRVTRWMPYLGLAVGLLLGVISVRRRRLEYAGALHSGESKGAQLLGIELESLIWAGAGTLATCALLSAYALRMSQSDPLAVLLAAARVAGRSARLLAVDGIGDPTDAAVPLLQEPVAPNPVSLRQSHLVFQGHHARCGGRHLLREGRVGLRTGDDTVKNRRHI